MLMRCYAASSFGGNVSRIFTFRVLVSKVFVGRVVLTIFHYSRCFWSFLAKDRGTKAINLALEFMYTQGFFIRKEHGRRLGEWMMVWIQCYGECARLCHTQSLNRFSLIPKLHFIHHTALEAIHQSACSPWIVNPIALSVQTQEDWVGRPSRVSRRVNARRLMDRLADRTLICCQQAMEAADADMRGLRG